MSEPSIPAIPHSLLKMEKSSADIRSLLGLLERTATHDPADRNLQHAAHLTGLLRMVGHSVRAQRSRLPEWCRQGAFSWERFAELPVLTRAELQAGGEAWQHPAPPPAYRPTVSASTSGSTGTPLVTWGHRAAGLMKHGLQLRMQRRLGFDFEGKCAFLTSPHPPGVADPPNGRTGPPWAPALGTGPSVGLTLMASTEDQLDWLIAQNPKYLATYPSNLLALLQLSEEKGLVPSSLESIVLSSEPITDDLVALARRIWGVECARTYSASETGLIASQVKGKDEYYVESENVYLELLRDDGAPCEPGEVGRVVVTTLQDFFRPLIRYEVGDYAQWAPAQPNDPITLPRLRRVVGRERTMIRLPDGRRLWPHFEFAPLMKIGGLEKWQLVQRRDESLLVRVVTRGPLTDALRDAISEVVRTALPGLVPEIVSVERIERTKGGKFMEVIRED